MEAKSTSAEASCEEDKDPLTDGCFKVWASSKGVWGNNRQISITKGSNQIIVHDDKGSEIKEDTFRIDVKLNGSIVESNKLPIDLHYKAIDLRRLFLKQEFIKAISWLRLQSSFGRDLINFVSFKLILNGFF